MSEVEIDVAESAGTALQRKEFLTDHRRMRKIKIGCLKYGDVRKAVRNGRTEELEKGWKCVWYLEEMRSRQYHVEVKNPCYGLRPPDSNPTSRDLPAL